MDIPVAVINPRRGRSFAQAIGKFEKPDKMDAQILAKFAAAVQPKPTKVPSKEQLKLDALVKRRRQLLKTLSSEKNRISGMMDDSIRGSIEHHMKWLKGERLIRMNEEHRTKEKILRSIQGIGPATSKVLIAELPQLGKLNRKQIVAFVGLTPHPRDSGLLEGKRGEGKCESNSVYVGSYSCQVPSFSVEDVQTPQRCQKAIESCSCCRYEKDAHNFECDGWRWKRVGKFAQQITQRLNAYVFKRNTRQTRISKRLS